MGKETVSQESSRLNQVSKFTNYAFVLFLQESLTILDRTLYTLILSHSDFHGTFPLRRARISGFVEIDEHDRRILLKIINFFMKRLTSSPTGYPYVAPAREGKEFTRTYLARERNRKLIESAKRYFLARYGHLTCQACGFDFGKLYGERGLNFIECHHKRPISHLKHPKKTGIKDLVIICSNCLRMLHNKDPWLSVRELKRLL